MMTCTRWSCSPNTTCRMKNDDVHAMVMFTKHHVQEIKRMLRHIEVGSAEPADQSSGLGHWAPSVVEEKKAAPAKESLSEGDFRESVREMKRVINEELLDRMRELTTKLDMQHLLIKRWTQGPGFLAERHVMKEDGPAIDRLGEWSNAPSIKASPTRRQPAQEVPFSFCGAPRREQNNVGSPMRQTIPQPALLPNPAQSISSA
mmetsp:Transcript_68268/g.220799  ORF Transcript_68268/g.220799 Transcript_68268/m.220799 type:complete len:203 (-) Transcript_68268:140-748(-)